jgi:hypothetical protein
MVPRDRKGKISLLKNVFSGITSLSEYLPKRLRIVIGADEDGGTQYFINESKVDQAIFSEASKGQHPGPITVNIIDTE